MRYAKFKGGYTFFAMNEVPIGIYYEGTSVYVNYKSANICTVSLSKEWFGSKMYVTATKDEFENALKEAKIILKVF